MRKIPNRIAFIGMRGSGKTTLGRLIAETFGFPLVDCDKELETRLGMPIRDMFSQFGEDWFRDQESACLADLVQGDRWIMACGGGVILREQNRSLLRERGLVVWLDAPAEILAERVTRDPWSATGRPPLIGSKKIETCPEKKNSNTISVRPFETVRTELEQVLADRKSLYEKTAHLRFPTGEGSPSDWVEKLKTEMDKIQAARGKF